MPSLTPTQQQVRDRIEALIGLTAPALDLLLTVGDRVSRIVGGGDDTEPLPVRPGQRPPSRATETAQNRL